MNFFPIVIRELLVASRRTATYRNRFWIPLAGLLISFFIVGRLESSGAAGSTQGASLFFALSVLGLFYGLIVGVRVTADCLSVEKRDGTLGLLFLTDLRGIDVVLGKLAATSLNSIYGLLALVPILAIPIQMGGITGLTFFQVVLCLLNSLFLSLATGIFISSLSVYDRKAMTAAILTIVVLSGGPFALLIYVETLEGQVPFFIRLPVWTFLIVSPVSPFLVANSIHVMGVDLNQWLFSGGVSPVIVFSVALLVSHVLSWFLLFGAARLIVSFVRQEGSVSWFSQVQKWGHRLVYGSEEIRREHRRRYLDLNAFAWLTSREQLKSKYVWIFVIAIAFIYLWNLSSQGDVMFDDRSLFPLGFIIHAFIKIWVASEACYRIAEDRRVGALELVLSTPLGPGDIIKGQFLALWRQFSQPLMLLVVLETILIFTYATEPKENMGFQNRALYLAGVVMLLVDAILIGWVAMWNGVRQGSANRAIVTTIVTYLMIPWGIYLVTLELWEALRVWLTVRNELLVDFRWMGPDGWRFNILWRPIDASGRAIMWSVVGTVYGLFLSLRWARANLLMRFRECVSGFQRVTE